MNYAERLPTDVYGSLSDNILLTPTTSAFVITERQIVVVAC